MPRVHRGTQLVSLSWLGDGVRATATSAESNNEASGNTGRFSRHQPPTLDVLRVQVDGVEAGLSVVGERVGGCHAMVTVCDLAVWCGGG